MTTVKVQARIDQDGKLRLEVPSGLPAGKAEVLIVVQPELSNGHAKPSGVTGSARSGLFAGKSDQHLDVDAALSEMNDAWKSKLTDHS
jgi:hypothetical protein